jgi:branched-chain amino acid transport system ATP-binding protein
MLEVKDVTVKFGGLYANKDVTLEVKAGSITGLIGPNGAGKTTFFNAISGVYKPTSGQVVFEGRDITGLQPYKINHLGMTRTYQIINLFKKMSVLENVMVGI